MLRVSGFSCPSGEAAAHMRPSQPVPPPQPEAGEPVGEALWGWRVGWGWCCVWKGVSVSSDGKCKEALPPAQWPSEA